LRGRTVDQLREDGHRQHAGQGDQAAPRGMKKNDSELIAIDLSWFFISRLKYLIQICLFDICRGVWIFLQLYAFNIISLINKVFYKN
jgi:hypothetical protein